MYLTQHEINIQHVNVIHLHKILYEVYSACPKHIQYVVSMRARQSHCVSALRNRPTQQGFPCFLSVH